MKWWTCTPVAFGGGEDFFARDSGLLSRGFRAIGAESRAVMPGPAQTGDLDELVRTDYANLESSAWWKNQGLDGVVLYAWGRPRFRRVAEAIHGAGVRLVLNQDSGGLVSPRCGLGDWLREQIILSGAGRVSGGWVRYLCLVGRGFTRGLLVTDPLRAKHLRQGDWVAAVSPQAAGHYQRLGAKLRFGEDGKRVAFVPHPVDPRFRADDTPREARVVAIGRWNDERQKRVSRLMAVADEMLGREPGVAFDVIGTPGAELERWHRSLGSGFRERVVIHGRCRPDEILALLRRARVSYCPSAFESFHIASAEALCAGCSVVAGRSVSLASFEWFVADGDGRQATTDEVVDHVDAVLGELAAWRSGEREPAKISARWGERLHAPEVARQVLALFGDVPSERWEVRSEK